MLVRSCTSASVKFSVYDVKSASNNSISSVVKILPFPIRNLCLKLDFDSIGSTKVGSAVGLLDGRREGTEEGNDDGATVGTGVMVGAAEGKAEGISDVVGPTDGAVLKDGIVDGIVVEVGIFDAFVVGSTVGISSADGKGVSSGRVRVVGCIDCADAGEAKAKSTESIEAINKLLKYPFPLPPRKLARATPR